MPNCSVSKASDHQRINFITSIIKSYNFKKRLINFEKYTMKLIR